jgi:hypothetical protein
MARVKETFQVDVALQQLFTRPTVAGLAEAMLADRNRRAAVERAAELMLSLNVLSDDQVARALAENPATNGGRPR